MNKKFTAKAIQNSFDDDFLNLEYALPDNENIVYNPDILKKFSELHFNSDFELVQQSLDSGKTVILPKDNVHREILDFEHYLKTPTCFYVIYNTIDDKYYIGMTRNINRRILDHVTNLKNRSHVNQELQIDFDNIKNKKLEPYKCFKVYTVQNTLISKNLDLEENYIINLELKRIENLLIMKYHDAGYNVYNDTGYTTRKLKREQNREKKEQLSEEYWSLTREIEERGLTDCSLSSSSAPVPVLIDGKEYPNISEAADQLNMNRRHLFNHILSKRFPNFKTVEQAETGDLYVYFNKKNTGKVRFINTITGEEKFFSNASQCNNYLTQLKNKADPEMTAKYKAAGIFVDKKTIYRKLERGDSPVFLYANKDDKPEKVLVVFD